MERRFENIAHDEDRSIQRLTTTGVASISSCTKESTPDRIAAESFATCLAAGGSNAAEEGRNERSSSLSTWKEKSQRLNEQQLRRQRACLEERRMMNARSVRDRGMCSRQGRRLPRFVRTTQQSQQTVKNYEQERLRAVTPQLEHDTVNHEGGDEIEVGNPEGQEAGNVKRPGGILEDHVEHPDGRVPPPASQTNTASMSYHSTSIDSSSSKVHSLPPQSSQSGGSSGSVVFNSRFFRAAAMAAAQQKGKDVVETDKKVRSTKDGRRHPQESAQKSNRPSRPSRQNCSSSLSEGTAVVTPAGQVGGEVTASPLTMSDIDPNTMEAAHKTGANSSPRMKNRTNGQMLFGESAPSKHQADGAWTTRLWGWKYMTSSATPTGPCIAASTSVPLWKNYFSPWHQCSLWG